MNDEILYATTQTVEYMAAEGQPSSDGTFTLISRAGATVIDAGTATRETGTWTVSSGGRTAANPRKLLISSTAGIETDRVYQLIQTGLPSRWVEVVEISTDTHVIVRADLDFDYSSATLRSTWLSASIADTDVDATSDIDDNWRGVWEYTVSGTTYSHLVMYDVVRRRTSVSPLTQEDVQTRFDTIGDYIRPDTFDLSGKIDKAWTKVLSMLKKDKYNPRLIRNLEQFEEVTYQQLMLDLIDLGVIPPGWVNAIEAYKRSKVSDRNSAYHLAVSCIDWYDDDDDETVDAGEERVSSVRIMERY